MAVGPRQFKGKSFTEDTRMPKKAKKKKKH